MVQFHRTQTLPLDCNESSLWRPSADNLCDGALSMKVPMCRFGCTCSSEVPTQCTPGSPISRMYDDLCALYLVALASRVGAWDAWKVYCKALSLEL